jgi:glycosyltransferase involved in cell wall biosynthesis
VTRVVSIVPARNEEACIAATVTALRAIPEIEDVLVVDDASSDRTAAEALRAGARVITAPTRRGKGAALRAGCARADADVVVFIDGDLGESAAIAQQLVRAVLDGTADMTIAAPPPSGPSGFGLVERLARRGIKRLAGFAASRPLSGQRALRREVLERCSIAERFGVETALTIDAVRAGFRVVELPLALEHARTGRDLAGFVHRARQGADVVRVLVTRALRRSR